MTCLPPSQHGAEALVSSSDTRVPCGAGAQFVYPLPLFIYSPSIHSSIIDAPSIHSPIIHSPVDRRVQVFAVTSEVRFFVCALVCFLTDMHEFTSAVCVVGVTAVLRYQTQAEVMPGSLGVPSGHFLQGSGEQAWTEGQGDH